MPGSLHIHAQINHLIIVASKYYANNVLPVSSQPTKGGEEGSLWQAAHSSELPSNVTGGC